MTTTEELAALLYHQMDTLDAYATDEQAIGALAGSIERAGLALLRASDLQAMVDDNDRLRAELRARDRGEPFKAHALRRLRAEVMRLEARVAELEAGAVPPSDFTRHGETFAITVTAPNGGPLDEEDR